MYIRKKSKVKVNTVKGKPEVSVNTSIWKPSLTMKNVGKYGGPAEILVAISASWLYDELYKNNVGGFGDGIDAIGREFDKIHSGTKKVEMNFGKEKWKENMVIIKG